MAASSIIKDLPILKWRGIAAPCESAPYRGSHSQAERRYPFIDAAGHDHTGRDPYQLHSCRLHFTNTIKPHNWYPTQWNKFREALESGKSGDLDHPDLGTIRCRVLTWEVDLSTKNLAGVTVDVTWTETVDNLDERVVYLGPDKNVAAIAEAADQAMSDLGIAWPDGKSQSSFKEFVGAVEGNLFSARLTAQGLINQCVGTIDEVYTKVQKSADHIAWMTLGGLLTSLYSGMVAITNRITRTEREVAQKTVASDTTIDAIARDTGNTVNDIVGLNLGLLVSPTVKKGTIVLYYTGGQLSSLRPPGP